MPRKKTTETVEAVEAAPKKTTKKTTAKKETAEKPAVKKTAAKKTTVKKTVKTETTETKKTTRTRKTVKKAEAVKESKEKYMDVINWKKWEAHNNNELCIEIKASELNNEVEAGVENLETCCDAMLSLLLEGDAVLSSFDVNDPFTADLTVRYYCDNLSMERRSYWDAND